MACCIIAAYLIGQFYAMLRRWAMFCGLVRPQSGEAAATLVGWLRGTNPPAPVRRGTW